MSESLAIPQELKDQIDEIKANPDTLAAVRGLHRAYFDSKLAGDPLAVRQHLLVEAWTFPGAQGVSHDVDGQIFKEEQEDYRHRLEEARKQAITVRINPANRTVDTRSPEYQEAWTRKFNQVRDEIEVELRRRVEAGELTIDTNSEDRMTQTEDEAIRYMAHTQAEQVMQQWALLSGIGLVGINEGYDHGRVIRYIDDPTVQPFSHEVVNEASQEGGQ